MSQFLVFNVGAAVFLVGFLIRDVILSRAVFAVGAAVFVYGFALGDGNFFALLWAVAILLVNMAVIWANLRDRFTTPLTPEEQALKKEMPQFSEGDFRRLMQPCSWQTLDAPLQLTEQGKPGKTLYYIVSGGATVSKSDKEIDVGDNILIGEISFSQDVPATATVHAHEGSVLISWPRKKLKRLLKRKSLKAGFDALLSNDLAEKLANDEARSASDG
ncbi:MAG: cyclic nucleotide-binding domain-containing protein [Parvibaculales bacterium]